MTTREEEVLVLFGSHTGNSEQVAMELCDQADTHLSVEAIQKFTGTKDKIHVKMTVKELDDFIDMENAPWTRLVVIVTSSYGYGQAPLNCTRFRELCDSWLEKYNNSGDTKILDGVYFAMCGLGDSKYETYFRNPIKLMEAMETVGAKRVGPVGKANASGKGEEEQFKVIKKWTADIWKHLAEVVVKEPLPKASLDEMQRRTMQDVDALKPAPKRGESKDSTDGKDTSKSSFLPLAIGVLALAVVGGFFLAKN